MSLINREELLASIMDDGGIQYPRWWYVDKVKSAPEAFVLCKDCKYSNYVRCPLMDYNNGDDDFCSRGERRGDGRPD